VWSAPGAGSDIDGGGIIYEPFITLVLDEGSGHYHERWNAHRYGPTGAPLADILDLGSVEEGYRMEAVVTPNHLAILELNYWNESTANVWVRNVTTNAIVHHTGAGRGWNEFPNGFIAGAGDDVGFIHEPGELVVWDWNRMGYQLDHLKADGTSWNILHIPPQDPAPITWYPPGAEVYGLAGGPDGDLAMLGSYRPFDLGDSRTRPDVGLIQAFAP